jgi:HK97 family phage major capsid protein
VQAKRAALAEFIGEDWEQKKFTDEQLSEIDTRNREIATLHDEYKKLEAVDKAARENRDEIKRANIPVDTVGFSMGGKPGQQQDEKSLGTQFVESNPFKSARTGSMRKRLEIDFPDYEFKTTMTTSAGYAAVNARTNIVIPSAQRRPVVADLIPQDPTQNSVIKYMEETTFTNNAATVAENAAKPESALAFTERSANVVKIATWIPVTEEQLDDVPQARALIDNRLGLMLSLAEETELLTGDGTANHLDGFLHKVTQSQAKGADPTPTAVYKSFTKIRFTGFAEPDGIVAHPNDWEAIATLQDGNGNYVWGRPFDAGPVARLWGVPVIVTPAETENTMLVGSFQGYSHISRKMGVTLKTSDSHASNFTLNVIVILIEERLSLEIYRPAAFCLVTGV